MAQSRMVTCEFPGCSKKYSSEHSRRQHYRRFHKKEWQTSPIRRRSIPQRRLTQVVGLATSHRAPLQASMSAPAFQSTHTPATELTFCSQANANSLALAAAATMTPAESCLSNLSSPLLPVDDRMLNECLDQLGQGSSATGSSLFDDFLKGTATSDNVAPCKQPCESPFDAMRRASLSLGSVSSLNSPLNSLSVPSSLDYTATPLSSADSLASVLSSPVGLVPSLATPTLTSTEVYGKELSQLEWMQNAAALSCASRASLSNQAYLSSPSFAGATSASPAQLPASAFGMPLQLASVPGLRQTPLFSESLGPYGMAPAWPQAAF